MAVVSTAVSLLTPFPAGRIDRAWETCRERGMVTFGSDKEWDFWNDLKQIIRGSDAMVCQTLIYLSNNERLPVDGTIQWTAICDGWSACIEPKMVEDSSRLPKLRGYHRELGMYRPMDTWRDDDERFVGFMELMCMRELSRSLLIRDLNSYGTGKPLAKQKFVHGPQLVQYYDFTVDPR